MNKHAENPDGYIVYEDGGANPIVYAASEKWFETYDEAICYAKCIIAKRVEEFKICPNCNSVVVYEGHKDLLYQTHADFPGRVVFAWNNYKAY